MDQKKIGLFISMKRKEKHMTQKNLAEQLGVSDRAVSKWERGICLMDMSLLKPLSEALEVNIIDILSGEVVSQKNRNEKYEESIEQLAKINHVKSVSFGIYGLLIIYVILICYEGIKELNYLDLVSSLCMFNAFKFYSHYQLTKDKNDIMMSIILFFISIFLIIVFVIKTW